MAELGVLSAIVARRRAAIARRQEPLLQVRREAEAAPRRPLDLEGWRAQRGAGVRVIAEFKRRSPSAGVLQEGDPVQVVAGYAAAGAVMASVLTEASGFGGSLDDLARVAADGRVPVLRKDFLLDEYDLCEARRAGAAAALLIARVFPDRAELQALVATAEALGLVPLVEAHDQAEAEAALHAGARLIGVNHRDLQTLKTDLSLSQGLRAALGPEPLLVAESGLRDAADLRAMAARGMDAVLVGASLLRTADPGAALRAWLAAV